MQHYDLVAQPRHLPFLGVQAVFYCLLALAVWNSRLFTDKLANARGWRIPSSSRSGSWRYDRGWPIPAAVATLVVALFNVPTPYCLQAITGSLMLGFTVPIWGGLASVKKTLRWPLAVAGIGIVCAGVYMVKGLGEAGLSKESISLTQNEAVSTIYSDFPAIPTMIDRTARNELRMNITSFDKFQTLYWDFGTAAKEGGSISGNDIYRNKDGRYWTGSEVAEQIAKWGHVTPTVELPKPRKVAPALTAAGFRMVLP